MLTDAKLEVLEPAAKSYRLADEGGLCVEVPPTGARLWRFRYRHNGKARMIALGAWPDMSLAEARRRRDAARRLLAFGVDPGAPRAPERAVQELTFSRLAGEWRQHRDVSEATAEKDAWLLGFADAAFGDRLAADVSSADVLMLLQSLAERGLPEAAHRLRSKLSAIFRYGKRYLAIQSDPAANLPGCTLRPRRSRHRVDEPRLAKPVLQSEGGSATNG